LAKLIEVWVSYRVVARGAGKPEDMKPKLLVIGPIPPPYYGVAVATQRILTSTLSQDFDLLSLDTSDRREKRNFGKLDATNILLALKHIAQLIWLLLVHRPHIIYIPISQSFLPYFRDAIFIVASKMSGAQVVLHLRGGYFRHFYEKSLPTSRWMIRRTIRMADAVIVLGESLKGLFDGLLPPCKIRVVPNGVDAETFGRPSDRVGNNGVIRLCFLSNLVKTKGYVEVLKALKFLATEYKLECVFAGQWDNEEEREETLEFVEKNSLSSVARFVGVVKGEEKWKLLRASDIFVFPTYFPYEGHPWVILEAMAAGLPVISTDHGAIAETVVDGVTGYLVPKRNVPALVRKIEKLIIDPELRSIMGMKGRERIVTKFSERNFIQGLGRVFSEFTKRS